MRCAELWPGYILIGSRASTLACCPAVMGWIALWWEMEQLIWAPKPQESEDNGHDVVNIILHFLMIFLVPI